MLPNQSILGLSLLVLSCASPSLGAVADFNPPSPSPPSSPIFGTLKDSNPSLSLVASTAPAQAPPSTLASPVAAVVSTSSVHAGTNPTAVPSSVPLASSLAVSMHPSGSRHASIHRGKLHSSIAAHFNQNKLSTIRATSSASQSLLTPAATSLSATSSLGGQALSSSSTLLSASSLSTTSAVSSTEASSNLATPVLPTSSLVLSATRDLAVPTSQDLEDPNPDAQSHSETSERSRRTALLAAFLILGTLGALGGGVLCFRCGLVPCCGSKRRQRGPTTTDRTIEEGLRYLQKLGPVSSNEKSGSLIPGKPPVTGIRFSLPFSLRYGHAHTLSCSTCPPDSLNGVKSGVSGTGASNVSDWTIPSTVHEENEFEDVTHILSASVFSTGGERPQHQRHSAHSAFSQNTYASSLVTNGPLSTSASTSPSARTSLVSANTSRASRASEGGASLTAESYATCESRYSTPSLERPISRASSSSARASRPRSAFESISEVTESDAADSERYHSASPGPASSASSASGGSVSVLLMTPEQAEYARLADAALPVAGEAGLGEEDMDVDVDGEEGSEWDVARAYAYGRAPPTIPLPPVPTTPATPAVAKVGLGKGRGAKPVRGRPQTGVGLVGKSGAGLGVGAVRLGGRACVLMHG